MSHPTPSSSDKKSTDTTKAPSAWLRYPLALLVIACLPAWMAFGARLWWPLELMTHFRWQYLICCLLTLPLLLLLRPWPWKRLALVSVTLLLNLFLLVPYYTAAPATATKGMAKVKVMMANVLSSNSQHQQLLDLLKKERPDFFVLLEVSVEWMRALQSLRKTYPYELRVPLNNNFGIALMSRLPVHNLRKTTFSKWGEPSLVGDIQLGKKRLHVVGTHPVPPVGGRLMQARNDHMKRAGKYIGQIKGPKLLMGDLNCSPWSPYMGDLLQSGELFEARKGFGIGPTWLLQIPIFSIPIDHILLSKGIKVVDFHVGPSIGSDHRPVFATFLWPSPVPSFKTRHPKTQKE